MSKNAIIGVVAGLVIIAAGGYLAYSSSHKAAENAQMQKSAVSTETAADASAKKVAFSEFIKKQGNSGSYKCEVKQSMSDMENGGTVYVSGGNMRGDFSTIAEGRTMSTSFIMKDSYTYNWSSMSPKAGVKMKIAATAGDSKETAYSWSADQVGDYNCQPWTLETSKFEIPADVTFTMMGNAQ
jgi:hypothetical protein